MTNLLNKVAAISPKIKLMAKPLNIESDSITRLPKITADAVNNIGRKRKIPAEITASFNLKPRAICCSIKSIKMIEFLTMMPAPAMKPIIEGAVKYEPKMA